MGDWKKLLATAGVCGLFGLFASACSSSDSGGGPPVTEDQFPQQFSGALCDAIAPCCKTADIAYSSSTCKNTATALFTQLVEASSGANTTYDAAAAGNCLAALKAALQSCQSPESVLVSASCSGIFKGNLANGAACLRSSDCSSGLCDVPSNGSTTVCVAPSSQTGSSLPHGKAGDTCGGDCLVFNVTSSVSTTECQGNGGVATAYCYEAEGLYCASATQTCAALPAIGAACPDGSCVTGAYCDRTTFTCAAQHDSGSCVDSFEECSAKSYCDSGSEQCFAKKPDGYACNGNEECVNAVCSGASDTTDVPTSGICGPPPAATVDTCAGQLL